MALVGIEYTVAGIARLLRSLTIAAAVYCTIMKPDSVESSLPIRNAGKPSFGKDHVSSPCACEGRAFLEGESWWEPGVELLPAPAPAAPAATAASAG